jgi:Xaa-Pro aminopeptidase
MSRRRLAPGAIALLSLCLPSFAGAQEAVKPAEPPKSGATTATLLGQPADVYAGRRAALMTRVAEVLRSPTPDDRALRGREPLIVLRGADEPELEGKFRQGNDFAYLTGVAIPSAVLVLRPAANGGKGESVLYLPPASPFGGTFTVAHEGPSPELAARLGIDRVEPTSRLLADLFGAMADPMRPQRRGPAVLFARNVEGARTAGTPEARLVALLREGAPSTPARDLNPHLAALRVEKAESEVALLRRAIAATGAGLDAATRLLRPGVSEAALEGALLNGFLAHGAQRAGFASIVGAGKNAAIPHYFDNAATVQDGDLVVMDVGAEVELYTADITRTLPASGRFTPRQREVYQLVLDAQKAAEEEVKAKAGKVSLNDLTRFVRDYFKKSPLRAKDAAGQEQTMDRFFVHGLGHYLGMDVHDVGPTGTPLPVGAVFTIEPGLYLKGEGFGVRIEDDYLLTKDGLEKLSRDIPSDPDAIERLMAERPGVVAAPGNGAP